jgi:hypothetical protein
MKRSSGLTATAALVVALSVTSLRAAAPGLATPGSAAPMKPDQINTAGWNKAWTNLVNDVEQTFVPSSPRLLAVEVELALGNPGPRGDKLTLTIFDANGQTVASVTQFVSVEDFEHAMFIIPDGGIDVNPGETYSMKLGGGVTFGWKYVVGGYAKGAATFNGRPLLHEARSTFLFRTFGPA